MSDRHHATYRPGYGTPTPGHTYPPPPRSPTFPTPARSSMPSSIGYTSMYAGDMHILPSAAAARYPSAAVPRAGVHGAPPPSSSVPPASSGMSPPGVPSSVPTTTTRTYAVGHDPRGRPSVSAAVPHEPIPSSRSRRSATIDSSTSGGAARPPPVIVTTTRGAHPSSSSARSPVRANPRVSDAHLYAAQTQQPSSSSRSHSHHRHHRHSDADQQHPVRSSRDRDLDRERERTDAAMAARDADAYRSARPAVIYSSDPRHSSTSAGTVNGAAPGGGATTTINYGDDGYHYTNAGEMARYDLDHPGPRHNRHRRTESLDHGYYRPNVSYNANQRSINVNTSDDMSRNYASNTGRLYNGGVRTSNGPPPSTRGFDRINRAYGAPVATGSAPGPSQSSPVLRDVPPAAPVPPSPTVAQGPQQTSPRTDQTTAPPPAPSSGAAVSPELREPRETRDARRGRPVSLYQTAAPRSSHHEDFYRSREDEREMRQARDRTRSRSASHFRDEGVSTRGFGIRPPSPSARDDRRRRDPSREQHRERRESDAEGPSRLRDKVTRGVGIAAAAMGLSASPVEAAVSSAADDDDDHSDGGTRTSRRRKESSPREESVKPSRPRPRTDSDRPSPKTREARRADAEEDDEVGGSRVSPEVPSSDKARDSPRTSGRLDREKPAAAEAREGSNSDTSDRTRQRRASRQAPRPSGTFDPNDASDISKLREQLAGIKTDDGEDAKPSTSKRQQDENEEALESSDYESGSSAMATPPSRSRSPSRRRRWSSTGGDDEASTALVSTSGSSKPERSVRVVSPPRDKRADDKQPLKGILKQPKPSFPEEDSYPREGVALHKEDRRAKEVPPGARWTKIGRKFVNPEALTIGKERFEVRDDSVIVLRVLSKEEIQAYATATQQLRERRRGRNRDYDHDYDGERDGERDRDRDREHERDYDRDYDDRYDDRDRDREREKDRGDRDRDRGRRRRPRVEHYDDHDYDEYESARWPGV